MSALLNIISYGLIDRIFTAYKGIKNGFPKSVLMIDLFFLLIMRCHDLTGFVITRCKKAPLRELYQTAV